MSKISEHIPDKVLDIPNIQQYVSVLDGVQEYKDELIRKGNHFYNPILMTDSFAFYRQQIEELGWPTIPADFPKEILDNMYLNAENIMALRGSKMGFDYWLRVLTCGAPQLIDDSKFYPLFDYIILNDPVYGYSFEPEMFPYNMLYLFGGEIPVTTQVLTASFGTPYFALESLQKYINDNVKDFIGFISGNAEITVILFDGPRVPNPYANQFFVNNF